MTDKHVRRAASVADLERDGLDMMGDPIKDLYARKPPRFAVYRTDKRVLVQFADKQELSDEQRRTMTRLNPLRGQINGLIDGWRGAMEHVPTSGYLHHFWRWRARVKKSRADSYDRRVGDALVVGFEGDVDSAALLLDDIKQDLLNERVGLARVWYLLAAVAAGILLTLLVILPGWGAMDGSRAEAIQNAAGAGAFGAFFSIALAIRGRTVLPDLQMLPNIIDAILRITIGIIAAAVMLGLMLSNLATIKIGTVSLDTLDGVSVLVVGFIAGFSERFVPDLLAKAAAVDPPVKIRFVPPPPPPPPPAPAAGAPAGAAAPADAEEDPLPQEAGEDCCTIDLDLPDELVTKDEDLPAAAGGVERPATN